MPKKPRSREWRRRLTTVKVKTQHSKSILDQESVLFTKYIARDKNLGNHMVHCI